MEEKNEFKKWIKNLWKIYDRKMNEKMNETWMKISEWKKWIKNKWKIYDCTMNEKVNF